MSALRGLGLKIVRPVAAIEQNRKGLPRLSERSRRSTPQLRHFAQCFRAESVRHNRRRGPFEHTPSIGIEENANHDRLAADRFARQEDAILGWQGWLSGLVLAAMLRSLLVPALAREVAVETWFDDAAAYPALRLVDNRSDDDARHSPAELEPLPFEEQPPFDDDPAILFECAGLEFQIMPVGLMYKSYLAGEKEPRIQGVWLSEKKRGLIWETQVGGRVGLLRYGTSSAIKPQGWQFDLEGGAQVRIDPNHQSDVEAVDYRVGCLSTWRHGRNGVKAGYYHLSSHLGDEFLIRNPSFLSTRLNYVRDSAIVGWMYDLSDDMQVYGEVAYAVGHQGGAKPLELQYGYQYLPLQAFDCHGAPYFAINGHTREDLNWITGVNTTAGWLWRGEQTNHTFRVGMQYYTGPAIQYSFVGRNETLLGGGLWFEY
jgi:hypothetical protein